MSNQIAVVFSLQTSHCIFIVQSHAIRREYGAVIMLINVKSKMLLTCTETSPVGSLLFLHTNLLYLMSKVFYSATFLVSLQSNPSFAPADTMSMGPSTPRSQSCSASFRSQSTASQNRTRALLANLKFPEYSTALTGENLAPYVAKALHAVHPRSQDALRLANAMWPNSPIASRPNQKKLASLPTSAVVTAAIATHVNRMDACTAACLPRVWLSG